MMVLTGPATRAAASVVGALASALWGWHLLRSTPEPAGGPETGVWVKPSYRQVADPRLLATALGLAAPLALLAALPAPGDSSRGAWAAAVVAWTLSAGLGSVAVLCDLRTTYLPSTLLRPWAVLTAASALAAVATSLATEGTRGAVLGLRVVICVALARLLFWAWWRIGGGLGFGDVRLASILAADAALISVSAWSTWLLAGTALGAAWAVTTALARRRRPSALGSAFPYGPALAIGAWVALALR